MVEPPAAIFDKVPLALKAAGACAGLAAAVSRARPRPGLKWEVRAAARVPRRPVGVATDAQQLDAGVVGEAPHEVYAFGHADPVVRSPSDDSTALGFAEGGGEVLVGAGPVRLGGRPQFDRVRGSVGEQVDEADAAEAAAAGVPDAAPGRRFRD